MRGDTDVILTVDDNADTRELLVSALGDEGFDVIQASGASDALAAATSRPISLVLLDVGLKGTDGYSVCGRLRSHPRTMSIPVIMLTARNDKMDIAYALGVGADDYVTKPFHLKELAARIRAVLRRTTQGSRLPSQSKIVAGPITMDSGTFEAFCDNEPVALSVQEFRILWLLASSPGIVFSRSQLLDKLNRGEIQVGDRTIDVQINSIRSKLGHQAARVETIRGIGYRLKG